MFTSPSWRIEGPALERWLASETVLLLTDNKIADQRAAIFACRSPEATIALVYPRALRLRQALKAAPALPDRRVLAAFSLAALIEDGVYAVDPGSAPDLFNARRGAAVGRLMYSFAMQNHEASSEQSLFDLAQQTLDYARNLATGSGVRALLKRRQILTVAMTEFAIQHTSQVPFPPEINERYQQFNVDWTLAEAYATLDAETLYDVHETGVQVAVFPFHQQSVRAMLLVGGKLTQQEADFLTCHESFNPDYQDEARRQLTSIPTRHALSDSYVSMQPYRRALVAEARSGKPPLRLTGTLDIPDHPAYEQLRSFQEIRIVVTPTGIWCAAVIDLAKHIYVLHWWTPDHLVADSTQLMLATTKITLLLAAAWRDACVVQEKAFTQHSQKPAQAYPRPQEYKRRKTVVLPRIRWGSPEEHERLQRGSSRARATHTVFGFVRNEPNKRYVPPERVILQAIEDYAELDIDPPMPGIGQTYVRTHMRGTGLAAPLAGSAAPRIICRGLLTLTAVLDRDQQNWAVDAQHDSV